MLQVWVWLQLLFNQWFQWACFCLYVNSVGSGIWSHKMIHVQHGKEGINLAFGLLRALSFIQNRFLMAFQCTAHLLLTTWVTKSKQVIIFTLKYLTSSSAHSLRTMQYLGQSCTSRQSFSFLDFSGIALLFWILTEWCYRLHSLLFCVMRHISNEVTGEPLAFYRWIELLTLNSTDIDSP